MDAIIGLIGAIVGAGAGAVLTYYLSRPGIKMSLYNVSLSPWQPKTTDAIADDIIQHKKGSGFLVTPEETFQLFAKHDFVQSPDKTYQHPLLFTWYLYKANRDNENARIKNKAMPVVVKTLKSYLRQGLSDEFYAEWIEHQETLLSHITGEAKRNNQSITDIVKKKQEEINDELESLNCDHPVTIDEDGDYILNFGRFDIGFIWSNSGVHKETVRSVCGTLAVAFAKWDTIILEKLIKFFEGITWDTPIYSQAENHIREMLLRYSRVIVQGVISNTGRTPLSVLGSATLEIDSKGYRISGDEDCEIDEDLVIDLQLIGDDRVSVIPCITIGPGSSVPFVAASRLYIYEMPEADKLIGVYKSERLAHLTISKVDVDGYQSVSSSIEFRPNKALNWTP